MISEISSGFVLVRDIDPAEASKRLRLTPTGSRHSLAVAIGGTVAALSIGQVPHGWTLITDPRFQVGDQQLADLSASTDALRLLVVEEEGSCDLTAWSHGSQIWEMSYGVELDERTLLSGMVPSALQGIYSAVAENADWHCWFEVPILAVERITGWAATTARTDLDTHVTELMSRPG